MALNQKHEYSQWLYNSYIETTKNYQNEMRFEDFKQFIEKAISKHLQLNLNDRKLGLTRRSAREMLKSIAQFKKNPAKYPLYFVGEDSKKLSDYHEQQRQEMFAQWDQEQDERLAVISTATEIKP